MTQRAFIQLLILIVGVTFEAMGTGYGHAKLFPFSDYLESIRGYVYYICEHLKFIALSIMTWVMPASEVDYKTDRLFVVLAVLDFVDYMLNGNVVWFGIGVKPMLPISMNVVSIVLFSIYAHKQWKMNGEQF